MEVREVMWAEMFALLSARSRGRLSVIASSCLRKSSKEDRESHGGNLSRLQRVVRIVNIGGGGYSGYGCTNRLPPAQDHFTNLP